MLIIRDVFQVKWGRVNEAVALMKEVRDTWNSQGKKGFGVRIMTDAAGPFFTMVVESEAQDLADWQRLNAAAFADPDFAAWFARTGELVDSGRREFYNLES